MEIDARIENKTHLGQHTQLNQEMQAKDCAHLVPSVQNNGNNGCWQEGERREGELRGKDIVHLAEGYSPWREEFVHMDIGKAVLMN